MKIQKDIKLICHVFENTCAGSMLALVVAMLLHHQSLDSFASFYETSTAISTFMYQYVVSSFSSMILQQNKFTYNITGKMETIP
jgi:hypothetical protein